MKMLLSVSAKSTKKKAILLGWSNRAQRKRQRFVIKPPFMSCYYSSVAKGADVPFNSDGEMLRINVISSALSGITHENSISAALKMMQHCFASQATILRVLLWIAPELDPISEIHNKSTPFSFLILYDSQKGFSRYRKLIGRMDIVFCETKKLHLISFRETFFSIKT